MGPRDAELWLQDSGASHHYSPSPHHFQTLNPSPFPAVVVANKDQVRILGTGDLALTVIEEGESIVLPLRKVVCAPELFEPLTSTGQLCVDGYQVVFGDDSESSFIARKGELDKPLVHMIVKTTLADGILYFLRGTVGPLEEECVKGSLVQVKSVANSVHVRNVDLEDWEVEDYGPTGFCKSIRPIDPVKEVLPPSWEETLPRIMPSAFGARGTSPYVNKGTLELWHHRMGHKSGTTLQAIAKA